MLSGACLIDGDKPSDGLLAVTPSRPLFELLKAQLGRLFHYEGAPKPYEVYVGKDGDTLLFVSTNDICEESADPCRLLTAMASGAIESEDVVLKINPPSILPDMPPIYLKACATCEPDYPALIAVQSL